MFPAGGYRNNSNGNTNNAGNNGYSWSASSNNTTNAYNLNVNSGNANWNNNNRNNGFTVRCIRALTKPFDFFYDKDDDRDKTECICRPTVGRRFLGLLQGEKAQAEHGQPTGIRDGPRIEPDAPVRRTGGRELQARPVVLLHRRAAGQT